MCYLSKSRFSSEWICAFSYVYLKLKITQLLHSSSLAVWSYDATIISLHHYTKNPVHAGRKSQRTLKICTHRVWATINHHLILLGLHWWLFPSSHSTIIMYRYQKLYAVTLNRKELKSSCRIKHKSDAVLPANLDELFWWTITTVIAAPASTSTCF